MLTTAHFVVLRGETLTLAGHAVLCPPARYASMRLFGHDRLRRGFCAVTDWPAVEAQLAHGWEGGHVPARTLVARLLLGPELDGTYVLQWLSTAPLETDETFAAAGLDRYLMGFGDR